MEAKSKDERTYSVECENCGRFVSEIPKGVTGIFYCSSTCHMKHTGRRITNESA